MTEAEKKNSKSFCPVRGETIIAHGVSRGRRSQGVSASPRGAAQASSPRLLLANATPWLVSAIVLLLAGNAFAVDAKDIKAAADRAGNWLIEQFDLKEKVFGKGEQAKDVRTVAMCVTALCNHPRD